MASNRRQPKAELLKVWNNWEDGVGYYKDTEGTNGLYSARLFVGVNGMLQVTPRINDINLTATHAAHTDTFIPQYFFEASDSTPSPRLYVISNTHTNRSTSGTPDLIKLDLGNSTFGTIRARRALTSRTYPTGQPAKFQGNWYFSGSTTAAVGDQRITQLTTVTAGAGADVFTETATNAAFAGTHLGLINNQLCKYIQGSGVNILATDGTFTTTTDWGSFFEVGDRDEAALALAALRGAMFTYSRTGIHSFNDRGRSGLVVEDMASWSEYLTPQYMKPWKEGLLIAHPTGLLYYVPGNPPINIGISAKEQSPLVPLFTFSTGVELRGGKYHGFDVVGDNIYALYIDNADSGQAVSALALLLWGRAINSNPLNVSWNVVGASQVDDVRRFHGFYIAKNGEPIDADVSTPTLFWPKENADSTSHLGYIPIAGDGSFVVPRTRDEFLNVNSSTSVSVPNSEAYFSELMFPDGVDLTDIVIFTQDMAVGDSLEIRLLTDSQEKPITAGTDPVFDDKQACSPIQGNGRHLRKLKKQDVYRVMLHLTFLTSTPTGRTTPLPSIRQVALYGLPK